MTVKNVRILAAVAAMHLYGAYSAQGQLVINEIMQSNIDCLLVDNDFPDSWVEVYNTTGLPVALDGYAIGESADYSQAYKIESDVKVAPLGCGLIYCDKESTGAHASFRLDSGKGTVYLFAPDGTLADQLAYKKQPAPNIAYGRVSDGASQWGHMIQATPGAANAGGVADDVLPDPIIMPAAGLYPANQIITITVTAPDGYDLPADARLAVTVDGREPTADDALSSMSYTLRTMRSRTVRAKFISAQALTAPSTVSSFIVHPEDTDLSVVSITTDPKYLYDNTIGILMGELDHDPNWEHNWRRPMNIEYFDAVEGHAQTINQLGEARVMGAWSRRYEQKSLAVYANKRFGVKRFASDNFWPDKPAVTETKSFILRNGGNDFYDGRIRDQLAQELLGTNSPNIDWQAYRPVICYINGEYKGLYDLRERSNDDNIWANYDGLEDIDMVENWWEVKTEPAFSAWDQLTVPIGTCTTLSQLSDKIEIDNFLDIYALQAFVGNTDFVNNNIVWWRRRNSDTTGQPDRWRILLKDVDRCALSWQDVEHDYFQYVKDFAGSNDTYDWNRLVSNAFNLFLKNSQAAQLLIDRLAIAMGDYLQYDYMNDVRLRMLAELEPEYYRHLDVYFDHPEWWFFPHWYDELEYIKNWWPKRTTYMYQLLAKEFDLGGRYAFTVNRRGYPVSANECPIYRDELKGQFFFDREVRLQAPEGCGWRVLTLNVDNSQDVVEVPTSTYSFTAAPGIRAVAAEVLDPAGIDDISTGDGADACLATTVSGYEIHVSSPSSIEALEAYALDGRLVAQRRGASVEVPGPGVYLLRIALRGTQMPVTRKVIVP